MYVLGGENGTHSLGTVESFDGSTWREEAPVKAMSVPYKSTKGPCFDRFMMNSMRLNIIL